MTGGMQGGGQGAYPPPPAPARRSGGNTVLLWSLVGCGVIAVLLVIIGAVLVTKITKNPGTKGLFSVMAAVTPTAQSVDKIGASLEEYQKDHGGQYPPTLEALVPKYVSDKSSLVCGSSEDPKPMVYSLPGPDTKPEAIVVRVYIGDIVMPNQRQQMSVCLLKNGEVVSEQVARTVMSKSGRRLSERKRSY